jgi:ubiquinone/menaquinone biosynthesis C-methylase UbiE
MQPDKYELGYSQPVLNFLGSRTAESHAAFFLPRLQAGWRLLDAGCGPGTITLGLARAVQPEQVVGIDVEDGQFATSREQAEGERLPIEFRKASVYELPFPDGSFDAVFSHALFTHLGDPGVALRELRRVLRPGGLIGVRASDMGGILVDAESEAPARALSAYLAKPREDTKDPYVGRKLGRLLRHAGFTVLSQTASYEVITEAVRKIGPALAQAYAPGSDSGIGPPGDDASLFVAIAMCEVIGCAP